MGLVPDAPAVVLVAFSLACALLLVEVALPTFGVAGLAALAFAAFGAVVVVETGHPWWPLVAVALAICAWAGVLLTWVPTRTGQLAAPLAFAAGGVTYGSLAGDVSTVLVALAGAAGLAGAFRPLLRASDRLLGMPPQLGMESLLDRVATVERWSGGTGAVRLDGSLWNARSDHELRPGDEVVVHGTEGMTVHVAPNARSAF